MEQEFLISLLLEKLKQHGSLEGSIEANIEAAVDESLDDVIFALTKSLFDMGHKNQASNNLLALDILGKSLSEFSSKAYGSGLKAQNLFYRWMQTQASRKS